MRQAARWVLVNLFKAIVSYLRLKGRGKLEKKARGMLSNRSDTYSAWVVPFSRLVLKCGSRIVADLEKSTRFIIIKIY